MHMSMLVKGPEVQTSCSNTFYRLLPMIYNSNHHTQLWRYRVYRSSGGGGGGALTSR
jgi:hypothetical protein